MRFRPFLLALLLVVAAASARAQAPDWVYHHGPFSGGSVMAVHPNGAIFSQMDGHVLISWDDGRTWTVQSEEPFAARLLDVLPDGSLLGITFSRVGRSFDLGRHWDDVRGIDGDDDLRYLAVDPNGPWYVTTDTTIYRTADEGETWVQLPPADSGIWKYISDTVVAENGALIVTLNDHGDIYLTVMRRSTDGGQTWEDVPTGGGTRGRPLTRNPDGSLFLASYDPDPDYFPTIPVSGLFRSVDDGETWARVETYPTTGAYQSPTHGRLIGHSGGIDWSGPDLPASAVYSFFEAPDGTLFANSGSFSQHSLDPPFFTSHGTGVYRLAPGASEWVQAGTVPASVHALHNTSEEFLLVGTGQAMLRSSAQGWEATGVNVPVRAMQGLTDGRVLLGLESPEGIRVAGEPEPYPFKMCMYAHCEISAFALDGTTLLAAVDRLYYSDAVGIYRTADDGATWTQTLEDIGDVRVLESAGDGVFFAGTYGQGWPAGVGVYRSLDDALTWEPFISGLTDTEVHALHADGPASVFAGTEDGVFYSQDGGAWVSIGLQGLTVYAFARTADGLIAGTDQGTFRYDGSDWDGWGDALSERAVQVLLPVDTGAGTFLVAGTDRGVYVDRPGLLTTPVETTTVPRRSSVRVYPNPARTTLTVGIELPGPSSARVVLLDVLGRRVRQVWDGPLAAGRHTLDASVEHLPGGTYLLVVETDAQRETRAVTVIR